jgi:hypothetical protein
MRWRRQDQSSGSGSANYQAGRDIVQTGVSASEVREIALDVYRSNFLVLRGIAEQVAADRAEGLTREFLGSLERENAGLLSRMQDPDMLSVLFTAQAGFARSGEPDLEAALVDLLVDRAGQGERDLKTLVLNEAIETLPKLTSVQRRALALCFLFRYTAYTYLFSIDKFYSRMEQWGPIIDIGTLKRADLQYLQAAGAGSLSISSAPLAMLLAENCRGFFYTGFAAEDIPEAIRAFADDQEVFVKCLRHDEKTQINAASARAVSDLQERKGIASDVLENFSHVGVMSHEDILAEIVKRVPQLAVVVERWEKSGLANFELTAAGIAIGHAYWKKIVPAEMSAPLDIWLSE